MTTEEPTDSVPEGGTCEREDFDPPLETREFPVTTGDLRKTDGDYRVDTDEATTPLADSWSQPTARRSAPPTRSAAGSSTLATGG